MRYRRNKKIISQRGYISTILVLLLLGGIFYYYFSTRSQTDIHRLDDHAYGGYLDQNTLTLNTIAKLESGEIALKEREKRRFKIENYSLNVIRGNDLKTGDSAYSSYLFETMDEKYTHVLYQFLIVGVARTENNLMYHLVYFRNKRV